MFETYTGLSAWFEIVGLCVVICCYAMRTLPVFASSLMSSVIANAIAVGLAGPLVIAYTNMGTHAENHMALHKSNAIMHAVPACIATLCIVTWPQCARKHSRLDVSIGIILTLSVVYLLCPCEQKCIGFEKVRNVYEVTCGMKWCGIVASIVLLLLVLLHYPPAVFSMVDTEGDR